MDDDGPVCGRNGHRDARPQTNGKVERFNRPLAQTAFSNLTGNCS